MGVSCRYTGGCLIGRGGGFKSTRSPECMACMVGRELLLGWDDSGIKSEHVHVWCVCEVRECDLIDLLDAGQPVDADVRLGEVWEGGQVWEADERAVCVCVFLDGWTVSARVGR